MADKELSIREEEKRLKIKDVITPGDTPYTRASRFEDLNLSPELLKGLHVEMKFEKPRKIQAISLPMIMTPPHNHLIAQAHNGSGKTTCFLLGMLSRVDPTLMKLQALCVCPTRELANRNMEVLRRMATFTGITSKPAVPGSPVPVAENPAHVVIGTPGTIMKWITFKKIDLVHLKILVFDEADHMLATDGFRRDDSLTILNHIKRAGAGPKFQVLIFSATFNDTVKAFVGETVTDPNRLFNLLLDEPRDMEVIEKYFGANVKEIQSWNS